MTEPNLDSRSFDKSPDMRTLSMTDHVEEGGELAPQVTDMAHLDVTITQSSWWDSKKILGVSFFVNLAALSYGIDSGTVNGFQAMPGFLLVFGYKDPMLPGGLGIATEVQQLITSLVSIGQLISALLSGKLSDYIGRKGCLWLGCLFVMVSAIIQITVTTIGGLYAGRFILGLGNGFLLTCSQLYMHECMPSNLRSLNFTIFQIWAGLGTLLGAIVDNSTATILSPKSYQIPLAVNFIGTGILAIGLFFLPESPRLLSVQGKNDEALKALRFLRDHAYSDLQVQEEMAEIEYAINIDLESTEGATFLDIFRGNNLRRTLTSIGVALFLVASGAQFILQYAVYFFVVSGDTQPFRNVVILLTLGLASTFLTPLFTGRVGKRGIIMSGAIIQGLCMLGMGIVYSVRGIDLVAGRVIVSMACIYIFVYGSTTSPFVPQIFGEMASQPLRGFTFSMAWATTFLFGWLLVFTAPYFINPTALAWGPQYAYIWAPTNFLCAVFVWFFVPETNKRTLEEIDECWVEKVPIRKFSQYKCVGTTQAREVAARNYKRTEGTERAEVQSVAVKQG